VFPVPPDPPVPATPPAPVAPPLPPDPPFPVAPPEPPLPPLPLLDDPPLPLPPLPTLPPVPDALPPEPVLDDPPPPLEPPLPVWFGRVESPPGAQATERKANSRSKLEGRKARAVPFIDTPASKGSGSPSDRATPLVSRGAIHGAPAAPGARARRAAGAVAKKLRQ
jgi:hypothetical protein